MNKLSKYRRYFIKEYLMGSNSFRLLEELLRRNPFETCFDRTLDLGCGMATRLPGTVPCVVTCRRNRTR